jgi:hypothetical protein
VEDIELVFEESKEFAEDIYQEFNGEYYLKE